MTTASANPMVTVLHQLFTSYGLPHQLVSDNGPQFVADEFKMFMEENGAMCTISPVIECTGRTFCSNMQAMKASSCSIQHRIELFIHISYFTTQIEHHVPLSQPNTSFPFGFAQT